VTAPGESKSNPKSNSESESGGAGDVAGAADTGAGVTPKRSRKGESMSRLVSTLVPRGRTGCGAWKTPTAPCPGAATSSSPLMSAESGEE